MNVITQLHPAEFPPLTAKTGFECKAEPVYMQLRDDAGQIVGATPIAAHSVIRRTDNGAALGITGDRYTIAHNQGFMKPSKRPPGMHCPPINCGALRFPSSPATAARLPGSK